MNNAKNINVLGFDISVSAVSETVKFYLKTGSSNVVNTINPHSYVEQKSDPDFNLALRESDVLIPDGSGFVLAAKVINGVAISKIAGTDLFFEVMKQLNETGGRVFFLGSSEHVLEEITKKASVEFKNIEVATLSPPFKPQFDEQDISSFADAINGFMPDVVFVGLTAPKQEKLISVLRSRVDVKFLSGIGAVFDFYAGTVKRPAQVWLDLHLEWLVRLLGEPKRLWRRNFVSTPLFLLDVFLAKIKK